MPRPSLPGIRLTRKKYFEGAFLRRSLRLTPLVSVIIPTYNRASLIDRAVASVLGQTRDDLELVVVDDGSTDVTVDLLAGYRSDPRFHILCLPQNRGVSAARNAGAGATGAPWIAFLDSDDEWLPDKLSRQLRWSAANPELEIVQTQELWIRHGRRVNPPRTHEKFGGDLFAASLERCMITPILGHAATGAVQPDRGLR